MGRTSDPPVVLEALQLQLYSDCNVSGMIPPCLTYPIPHARPNGPPPALSITTQICGLCPPGAESVALCICGVVLPPATLPLRLAGLGAQGWSVYGIPGDCAIYTSTHGLIPLAGRGAAGNAHEGLQVMRMGSLPSSCPMVCQVTHMGVLCSMALSLEGCRYGHRLFS